MVDYRALTYRAIGLVGDYLGQAGKVRIIGISEVSAGELLDANLAGLPRFAATINGKIDEAAARTAIKLVRPLLRPFFKGVLGQYGILLDSALERSIFYVDANLAKFCQDKPFSQEDFALWIALHEVTHAYQNQAYPWVKPHYDGLVEALFRGTARSRLIKEDIMVLMTMIEGHAMYVMNQVGEREMPSYPALKAAWEKKHPLDLKALVLSFLFRKKLVQYKKGEAFFRYIGAMGEAGTVWDSPENLPTLKEIDNPALWFDRVISKGG